MIGLTSISISGDKLYQPVSDHADGSAVSACSKSTSLNRLSNATWSTAHRMIWQAECPCAADTKNRPDKCQGDWDIFRWLRGQDLNL
ncbi:MAG: hypothetical protein BVN32_07630 [Proteobacteria bacterium ST_bin14]|nr:MAG: hypothetical protein BVN32_07630 [Proteobacteria bacterium ST_bin14]